jgi:hypothetical protein
MTDSLRVAQSADSMSIDRRQQQWAAATAMHARSGHLAPAVSFSPYHVRRVPSA